MQIRKFGIFNGQDVFAYTLTNGALEAEIITYGGTWRTMRVPDKNGTPVDVVLGYDNLDGYLQNSGCIGGLIGRFGNRIEFGKFTLNGIEYQVPARDRGHACHAGDFHKRLWQAEVLSASELAMHYTAQDGEDGFPGKLSVTVRYTLTEAGMCITYDAVCDADTIINLTHHAYFNLNGMGDIRNHTLFLNADAVTPVDETLIPHGEISPVTGSPFDFTTAKTIGRDIDKTDDILIRYCTGYDTNFVLNGSGYRKFTESVGDLSGIRMVGYTDQPGVQLYTGNMLRGQTGKYNIPYTTRTGFCLETQNFPNAVNCPEYPSPILRAGDTYHTETAYLFFAE